MNPLSAIFAAGVAARNALYDRKIFRIRRLARPVISVGNISVGGSGKTPFVIALGQLLKERGIAFDVLSRGYGRSKKDIAIVDPQGEPREFGDEPLLIARSLQVPVIVGADRYQAGLLAEQKFASTLHLLDDGFQHRRLHRDFDIVMIQDSDFHDTLLPVGRLREPPSSLLRADLKVMLRPQPAAAEAKTSFRLIQGPVSIAQREMVLHPSPGKAVAFCGIARPQQFFEQLRSLNVALASTRAFPDHHRYSEQDVERLLAVKKAGEAQYFITTEKDQINLGALAERLRPLEVARLRMVLDKPKEALDRLLKTLEQRCGCGF